MNRSIILRTFAGLALSAAAVSVASASSQAKDLLWVPVSTTAESITGPLAFDGKVIQFENGARLQLKEVKRWGVTTLYQVSQRTNPVLRHGNFLCSEDLLPRFVASTQVENSLVISVIEGDVAPAADADVDEAACAEYRYIRR
ncbi:MULTISPECIES: hypothetical protein [Achromobacter]|uniref:hypothetical protein n=1 Tax=Achromobacter TaxID=222 RepID=UPI0023F62594|nr:hypothetical protein [Achromobacter anxifer]MDF8365104.1 hypothetical protein [Achromobacter anxifer]